MMSPLVSILVPIYGVEQYIERCACSLMEQTYEHCEFVFVDDCTLDNSISLLLSVIDKYPLRKNQVKVIRHDHNKGLGGARLTGVKNSTGEYITFVDSDDWVEPDYVERLVEVIKNENADLVISSISQNSEELLQFDSDLYIRKLLMRRGSPHIWGNLVCRDIMTRYRVFPIEGIDMAEDFHFMTRYAANCQRVFLIQRQIYHYTPDNPNSYTKQFKEKDINSELKSIDTVFNYFKASNRDMTPLLNVSLLEFYKAKRMGRYKIENQELLNLYRSYISKRNLNFLQRCYLFALNTMPMCIVKLFSFYYSKRYIS